MDFKYYIGKRVFIKTFSDRVYSGEVLEVTFMGFDADGVEISLITLNDKFDSRVCFNNKEIKFIEEEKVR